MEWNGIDKRRFLRIKFPYTVHMHTEKGKDISTYAEDISCGGIGITIRDKLNVGDRVMLKIYLPDNPIECKGNIVWVKEKSNALLEGIKFFNIGIEFEDIDNSAMARIKNCVKGLKQNTKDADNK